MVASPGWMVTPVVFLAAVRDGQVNGWARRHGRMVG